MIQEKRIEWKWNDGGENCPRSMRTFITQPNNNNGHSYDSADNAIKQCLEEYNNIDMGIGIAEDIIPIQDIPLQSDNYNKREEIDTKMSGRQLVFQRGTNPFTTQTSYVDDIIVRDMYLKPINTTSEKAKTNNNDIE